MFKVFIVDETGEEHWVWSFPTHQEADAFMKENNVENFDYVVRDTNEMENE